VGGFGDLAYRSSIGFNRAFGPDDIPVLQSNYKILKYTVTATPIDRRDVDLSPVAHWQHAIELL
jgi:hypothetical protein